MKLRSAVLVCLVASAGLLAQPADARPRHKEERQQQQEQQQEQQQPVLRPDSLRDDRGEDRGHRGDRSAAAARRAQQQNGGGRVLSVEPDGAGYRVKVLKDGEVRTHHVEDE
jgi:hypothetical protein